MKEIRLSNGAISLVDDSDFESLSKYKWSPTRCKGPTYAVRFMIKSEPGYKKTRWIRMHRVILNALPGQTVDHVNGNGLDNRRENLRFANKSQNAANCLNRKAPKSGFKGVYANKKGLSGNHNKPWNARISVNGKEKSLGYFKTREEAAIAYNEAAEKFHGAFAVLNKVGNQ